MARRASHEIERIVTGYDGHVRAVRARTLAFLQGSWNGLGEYRDSDITSLVKRVVPVVAGGQRNIAAATDAYLAAVQTKTLGGRARPLGIPSELITTEAVRGVPARTVYRRPGITVWTALSKGSPPQQAIQSGLSRLLAIGATDLQLARTHATQYALSNNENVAGYRRVPGGVAVCALCLEASDQDYRVEELMPIHGGCSCGVEPFFHGADPGELRTPDEPSDPDRASGLAVHEHGELGPVLAVAGQAFTGPDDF